MAVLGLSLIWFGIACLALVLWRGYRLALLNQFTAFYSYIVGDLVGSFLVSLAFGRKTEYARWYWIINFVTLFLGCTILWEMLSRIWLPLHTLRCAARTGQAALAALLAVSVAQFALIEDKTPLNNFAFRRLERDSRAIQTLFFVTIVWAMIYYAIPVGKNLKAICFGYGLYVCASLTTLAAWLYAGSRVALVCDYLQAASFDAAAAIRLVGLWGPIEPLAAFASSAEQLSESEGGSLDPRVRLASIARRSGPKAAGI